MTITRDRVCLVMARDDAVQYRQIIITTIILLLFAVIGTTLVAFTFENTREQIAANERATLLRKLHQLILQNNSARILCEDPSADDMLTLLLELAFDFRDGFFQGGSD